MNQASVFEPNTPLIYYNFFNGMPNNVLIIIAVHVGGSSWYSDLVDHRGEHCFQ